MNIPEGEELTTMPFSELLKDPNCIVVETGEGKTLTFAHDGLFAKAVKTWRANVNGTN